MDWGSLPWANIGATGVLALVVLMILRGAIVPRSTLDDVRADRDARLEEKQREIDALRKTMEDLGTAGVEQSMQITTLLEVARTAQHVLVSLPEVKRGDDS
jgi:hypothetical protein